MASQSPTRLHWLFITTVPTQYTPQTHLITRSLVEHSQEALYNVINFVEYNANKGIDALASKTRSRDRFL